MAFLAGWTFRLHNDGYISGVYSSASSGIKDLVTGITANFQSRTTSRSPTGTVKRTAHDPYVPAGEWSQHQRLHQYLGNQEESYGGVT